MCICHLLQNFWQKFSMFLSKISITQSRRCKFNWTNLYTNSLIWIRKIKQVLPYTVNQLRVQEMFARLARASLSWIFLGTCTNQSLSYGCYNTTRFGCKNKSSRTSLLEVNCKIMLWWIKVGLQKLMPIVLHVSDKAFETITQSHTKKRRFKNSSPKNHTFELKNRVSLSTKRYDNTLMAV